ncbi:hypothetical protein AGMMS49593_09350 [Endomicrobiia bacterium]|nr:hypothetical protein AGMMS49593_09350 [Endomicrobiia bacterium]
MKSLRKIVLLFILFFICNVNTFAKANKTYDKLKLAKEAMEIIQLYYFEEINPEDLGDGIIGGLIGILDDGYSNYFKENNEVYNLLEGYYVGLGLSFEVQNNRLVVTAPILGTPAYKAGILPEDMIIKIDGKSTEGMSHSEAVSLMRGKAGKKLSLQL